MGDKNKAQLHEENKALKERVNSVADREKEIADKMAALEKKEKELAEKEAQVRLAATLKTSKSSDAINHPVEKKYGLESSEQFLGEEYVAEFKEERVGDASGLTTLRPMEIDGPEMTQKFKNLEFMNQKVQVYILDTAEKDAQKIFSIWVNGKEFTFERGKAYTVPRYAVEGLARAKPVHYDNEEYTTDQGLRAFRYPSRKGVRYPFNIMQDPHPRGGDWIKHVLAQP